MKKSVTSKTSSTYSQEKRLKSGRPLKSVSLTINPQQAMYLAEAGFATVDQYFNIPDPSVEAKDEAFQWGLLIIHNPIISNNLANLEIDIVRQFVQQVEGEYLRKGSHA